MPRPDQIPTLPVWPFLVGDVALLATATYLEITSHHPLATGPLVAIVSCVGLGAVLIALPFLSIYARRQDAALDERQRALESLGATVTASAEQIGIAATGVHEIAELVQKNLRAADQLPHKLQEKIGEFTAQLTNARADETEDLEKSLSELRASESERLAVVADKISKAANELAKLEASAQKHLAATHEAVAELHASSGSHFSEFKAATAAAIEQAQTAAVAAIDKKLAAAEAALSKSRTAFFSELDAKLASITAALAVGNITSPEVAPSSAIAPAPVPEIPATNPISETPSPLENDALETPPPEVLSPPKKRAPKKTAPPFEFETPPSSPPVVPAETELAASVPVPVPPATTDEFVQFSPEEIPAPVLQLSAPAPTPEPATPNPEPAVSTATPDGATRLLVTAYIGIGNRLFIRGHGPGLSWEKGTPLQFVSIGKWRWETNEAVASVAYKLYKNDALECATLGEQILVPSSQQEVTAVF